MKNEPPPSPNATATLGWRRTWFTDGVGDDRGHDGVLVDDGYLVGHVRRDTTLTDGPSGWCWWMGATSRFGRIEQTSGRVETEAEARQSVMRAYGEFCAMPGAREDFFAMTAAADMASGSWRA